jgi:hypothetical protein
MVFIFYNVCKNISLLFILSFYSKWLFNKFGGLSFFINLVSCLSICNFCCLSGFWCFFIFTFCFLLFVIFETFIYLFFIIGFFFLYDFLNI